MTNPIATMKVEVEQTTDINLLKDIRFAKDLLTKHLPEKFINEQQQRSIFADTIYFTLQRRLDELSADKIPYTLGELYLTSMIPKSFLRHVNI